VRQLQGFKCVAVNVVNKVIDHGAVVIAEYTVSAQALISLCGFSEQDDWFSEVVAFFLVAAAVAYNKFSLDYQLDKAKIIVTFSQLNIRVVFKPGIKAEFPEFYFGGFVENKNQAFLCADFFHKFNDALHRRMVTDILESV
jgi:hypothetical protein